MTKAPTPSLIRKVLFLAFYAQLALRLRRARTVSLSLPEGCSPPLNKAGPELSKTSMTEQEQADEFKTALKAFLETYKSSLVTIPELRIAESEYYPSVMEIYLYSEFKDGVETKPGVNVVLGNSFP